MSRTRRQKEPLFIIVRCRPESEMRCAADRTVVAAGLTKGRGYSIPDFAISDLGEIAMSFPYSFLIPCAELENLNQLLRNGKF
jgi:hypothetical protein